MLRPLPIPGLLITGTDTAVGKTLVAAAIANWFHRRGLRVAACKPIATGCPRRREGLVSPEAELLAHHGHIRFPLDLICPQRYAQPFEPVVAADRAAEPVDWQAIDRSLRLMSHDADVMLIDGVGGVMTPLDDRHTMLDLARWLMLPTILVARPGGGTVNHVLLSVAALRNAGVLLAGLVINRYPAELPGIAEEANLRILEKRSRLPLLAILPEDQPPLPSASHLPPNILAPIHAVDWQRLAATPPASHPTR